MISQASLRSHCLAHTKDTSDQAKINTKLRNGRQHSEKDKKESSFVNFFEVENAGMKLATNSATSSGMKVTFPLPNHVWGAKHENEFKSYFYYHLEG